MNQNHTEDILVDILLERFSRKFKFKPTTMRCLRSSWIIVGTAGFFFCNKIFANRNFFYNYKSFIHNFIINCINSSLPNKRSKVNLIYIYIYSAVIRIVIILTIFRGWFDDKDQELLIAGLSCQFTVVLTTVIIFFLLKNTHTCDC
jgi:hypothetical protein